METDGKKDALGKLLLILPLVEKGRENGRDGGGEGGRRCVRVSGGRAQEGGRRRGRTGEREGGGKIPGGRKPDRPRRFV